MEVFADEDAVARVGRGLLERSLPKSEWSHAAHFAAVLWLIRRRPDLPIREHLPGLIRAYNEATGTANTDVSGYHETITQASITAAEYVLSRTSLGAPLHTVLGVVLSSSLGRSDWLLAYWSRARLFSIEARLRWCEPDVRPFALNFLDSKASSNG